jgi:SAM-dependent methyltransferase
MEPEIYRTMAAVEESHWWFCSRRIIVRDAISRLKLPPNPSILEPGCGTGGNFAMLSAFGKVYATDSDATACDIARAKDRATVERGELPDHIPFWGLRPDLVVMTDVLEHLDRDRESLEALRARTSPGGYLVATVPATPWLWSEHDVSHHHRRRYTESDLRAVVETAGYKIEILTYFNFLLFPLIAAVRMAQRIIPAHGSSDLKSHGSLMNSLLLRVFSSERYILNHVRVPIGASLLVVARNP